MLINDLLPILKEKYGLTYDQLERIIDSQFDYTKICIENRTTKSIKWANLGKIKPSNYLLKNYEQFSKKA